MATISMADLLAKNESKIQKLTRNQEIEGSVVAITDQEIVLDLASKSEGVLPKRDLTPDQLANLKVGDKLMVFVVTPENESGQVVVTMTKALSRGSNLERWKRFQEAKEKGAVLSGRGLEVNRGGLIVEVGGIRGFLPSSQVALSQAQNLDELVGKDLSVTVIEVDPTQNRLIFSQKVTVSKEVKENLSKLKVGDQIKGKVAAVLPFGIFVSIEGDDFKGIEGLAHVSELSWEKIEDPGSVYKVGMEVEAKVISTDSETGRVNLSIRQLTPDPFKELASKYNPDDVIKGAITKVNNLGVFLNLEDGLEGLIPTSKMESDGNYEIGQSLTVLVDSVDDSRRRILLAPFITTTKDLIYK